MTEPAGPVEPVLARKMWRTLEPFHGFVYFSRDAAAEYLAVGLAEGRMGYFASRSAPMGAVTADVVTATFFNFDPGLVERSMDGAWDLASPAAVHEARLRGVDAGLRSALGGAWIASPEMYEALALARTAAEACTVPGRPLYAGHASLPWPEEPHLQLWLAVTLVREFRGDGHVAALTVEGLTGIEALHLHAASGEVPASILQASRGWSDEAWSAAGARLDEQDLTDGHGGLAVDGVAVRQRIEDTTDRLALAPWQHLGQDGSDRLRELVRPWSKAIVAGSGFGFRS